MKFDRSVVHLSMIEDERFNYSVKGLRAARILSLLLTQEEFDFAAIKQSFHINQIILEETLAYAEELGYLDVHYDNQDILEIRFNLPGLDGGGMEA